ncbi:MAG: histidine--tRNA ligase [Candidatus Enteromonas sp.]|nr:histidine--tRNA ligase [Candidatus Enteromonas sp.]
MPYIAVKGTHDIFGEEASGYAYIQSLFKAVAELYGYRPIETPILEYTEVFQRSTGESSDVVRKEMYTFLDKGNRSVTMRPEGTAGVARSIVEHKLTATEDMPLKVYYAGPIFRYERPQLGRYRQFIQAGVEAIGVDSPRLDAEAICLAMRVLSMLGFENLKIKVNTLGDSTSRNAYAQALREYFSAHIDSMCDDCKQRLLLNPMRILDCKVPEDQEIAAGAPKMRDFLSEEAERRFYQTLSLLAERGIDYEIDDGLVRGLDYYGQIVFEVHAISPSGKDYGALLGGGHYDGMLQGFGGPKDFDHGVGFAMGVERIYSLLKELNLLDGVAPGLDLYLIPLGEEVIDDCFSLVEDIRSLGYSIEMPLKSGKISTMFKKAERKKAKFALILGKDELDKGVVQIKNLATHEQIEADLSTLDQTLDSLFGESEEEHHHHHE